MPEPLLPDPDDPVLEPLLLPEPVVDPLPRLEGEPDDELPEPAPEGLLADEPVPLLPMLDEDEPLELDVPEALTPRALAVSLFN